jgi:hypothetical protein
MASVYQLNPVVKKIDKSDRRSAEAEGFVVEDPSGSFFDTLLKEKTYYRVARRGRDSGTANFAFTFDQHAVVENWRLSIDFKSTVAFCGRAPEDARQLVDRLKAAQNFDEGLENRIREWIDEFVAQHRLTRDQFISRFLSRDQTGALKAFLSEQARRNLFLEFLAIDLTIHGHLLVPDVETIPASPPLNVSLHDYGKELELQLTTDLRRIEGDVRPYLGLLEGAALRLRIREAVKDVLRSEISLQQWQFELQTTVRAKVEEAVRTVAETVGRKPDRLVIGVAEEAIGGVRAQIECDPIKEEFQKTGYPDPVEVSLSGRLVLENLGKLVASEVDPKGVLAWMHQMVQDTANAILLNEAYVKLFDSFESKTARMKEGLIQAAAGIGYKLCDPTIRTNLDFEILRDGIIFIAKERKFPLKVPECEVVLDIEARMLIEDRVALSKLFESRVGIKEKIFSVITEAVAAELRQVFPDQFYLNFFGSRDDKHAVEALLVEAVKRACIKKFGLKTEFDFETNQETVIGFEMNIKFTVREDELWKLFKELLHHSIPLRDFRDHNTGIVVDALCSVVQIPPQYWLRFWTMKPTPALVEQHVSNHVLSYLNHAAKHYGVNVLLNTLDSTIQGEVEQWVNQRLAESLGVTVLFTHWLRQDAEGGQPLEDVNAKIESHRQARRALIEQLRSAYVEGQSDAEIKAIEDRIKSLEVKIEELSRKSGVRDLIRPASDFHLIEAESERKRLAAPAPRSQEDL